MIRNVIIIDEDKCIGCRLCVNACHEGAIGIVDGKAKLLRDDYCDGLGNCLPACPTNAITLEQREAKAYDRSVAPKRQATTSSCQSSANQAIDQATSTSMLKQWPVQIKLVIPNAAFFEDAHLLIAADCSAFAYANFHNDFMKDKVCLIGCPKLDEVDYADKLSEILIHNNIKSVCAVRMEVPCCAGIENATIRAIEMSNKTIPYEVVTLSLTGEVLSK